MAVRLPPLDRLSELTPEWALDGATGAGVRVAVIDSGIEFDHPDLLGATDVEGGAQFLVDPVSGEVVERFGPHTDQFGHGTACAGIIHRLAPKAQITSIRVLGRNQGGKAIAFLRGLQWAVEQEFDVINLSLGTNKPEWSLPFYEICDGAYHSGRVVVTAANNLPTPSYPSMYGLVFSVACHTGSDPLRFHYQPDSPPEFLAYGIDVEVPWVGGARVSLTGNSFAAPHLSGIAALVLSKHPDLRPFQVKTVLWSLAANVREAPQAAGRLSRLHRVTMSSSAALRATSAVRRPSSARL